MSAMDIGNWGIGQEGPNTVSPPYLKVFSFVEFSLLWTKKSVYALVFVCVVVTAVTQN